MKKARRPYAFQPSRSAILREDPLPEAPSEVPDHLADRRLDEFLRYLRATEGEPTSTLSRQLIADGIALPAPTSFTEQSVGPKLWEVIHGLARRRHFLYHTDHLTDLELYRHLWELTLNEPAHELDDGMGECGGHLDLVSDGTDESIWLWLRYYADEETRQNWADDFPGEQIPPPLAPHHDRDRHLPKWEDQLRSP